MEQVRQAAVVQLSGRKIDGEPDVRGNGNSRRQKACLNSDIERQFIKTAPLGDRNEAVGGNQAQRGMLPASEDFKASDIAFAQIDQRLEVRNELVLAQLRGKSQFWKTPCGAPADLLLQRCLKV